MSLANISIVGNLVKPPEQMHFQSGKVKTTLIVAVNTYGKPNRGGDSADFYKVETWGKLAELAGQYLSKGNQVAVSGRLLFDRWTDKEGKNRFTPVVEVTQLSLPSRLKVVDSQGEQPSLPEETLGNVITGTLPCAEQSDPFEDAETVVADSNSLAELMDSPENKRTGKNGRKSLQARSA
jgi:single-strand DNA-binding protein